MQFDDDEQAEPDEAPEYDGLGLDRYKSWWKEWVDTYAEARKQSFRDEEYYDGDVKGTGEGHWLIDQLEKLKLRKQPPSVFNLVKRKINAIAGVEQRSRSEPRGLPRTPKDQYAAEIATDSLRYVKEQTRFPMISATAFLEALKVGYTACEIDGAEDCVPINGGEWRDYFFDPRSRRWDFSDVRYHGWAKWLDQDVAKETYAAPVPQPEPIAQPQIDPQPQDPSQWPQWAAMAQQKIGQYEAAVAQQQAQYAKDVARQKQIEEAIEATADGSGSTSLADVGYDDMPASTFCDRARKRIFVVDMWHQDPKHGWYRCVFTGAGKLFTEPATLIEKDRWGRKRPTHPIQSFSLYVSKDGWRYGEVRGMRSPQDEVNMRRSKALHLLTVNQIINRTGNHSSVEEGGKEQLRSEAARPDGYLDVPDPSMLRIEKNMDLASGQQQLGAEARGFLEMEGPNPQLQGEQGRATSGRAVLALQQAGLGQLGPIFDRFHDWEDRCYRSMWFRIQQFWTGPMYVRVTDDKNAARFAAVNGAPVLDENGQPKPKQQPPEAGAPAYPPTNQPQGMGGGATASPQRGIGDNNGPPIDPDEFETGPMLAELDMDIIIDRAPEAATLQAEQFETLAQLAQGGLFGPPGDPDIARMMITASALPEKTQLLDMLDKRSKEQKPNPSQMAELKKLEAMVADLVAKTQKTNAETAKITAEIPGAQAKTALTSAQARTENVTATMNEFGAETALAMHDAAHAHGPAPMMDAASPPGGLGLPPQTANGPPPY